MAYVRLDDQIAAHPKVLRAGAEAAWLWACAIAYCNRQLTDGLIPAAALPTLGTFRTPVKKLAATLVAVGLFDQDGIDYRVHDYLSHNPDRSTVEQRIRDASQRKAASRDRRSNGFVSHMSQRDTDETHTSSRGTRTDSPPTPNQTTTVADASVVDARAPSPPPFDVGASPVRRLSPRNAYHARRKGLSVPGFIHEELLSRMATPDEPALLAWYASVEAEYDGQAIGETNLQFWRARFAEWQGTTPKARVSVVQPLEDFIPARFKTGGVA